MDWRRREQQAADTELVISWARPLAWLTVIWLLAHGVAMLDLQQNLAGAILAVLMPLDWMVGTVFFFQLVDPAIRFVVGASAAKPGSMTRAAMGFPVISLVLKFAVVGVGLSEVLELFSFDVTTVLAGLGIGGLAFALAAQDTLKNFFGSIMLILGPHLSRRRPGADRRPRRLDRIGRAADHPDSRAGRFAVDDSEFRSDDRARDQLRRRRYRRFRTSLAVAYGTPLEQVVRFPRRHHRFDPAGSDGPARSERGGGERSGQPTRSRFCWKSFSKFPTSGRSWPPATA